jgi:hypothetical protein
MCERENEALACRFLTDSNGGGAGWGGRGRRLAQPARTTGWSRIQRDGEVTSRSHPGHYGIENRTRLILHFLPTGKREGRDEEDGMGEGKGKIDGRDT